MANPELSRKVARLFSEYKVPLDPGVEWAFEVEAAKSEEDLSPELQEFIRKPRFLKPKPDGVE